MELQIVTLLLMLWGIVFLVIILFQNEYNKYFLTHQIQINMSDFAQQVTAQLVKLSTEVKQIAADQNLLFTKLSQSPTPVEQTEILNQLSSLNDQLANVDAALPQQAPVETPVAPAPTLPQPEAHAPTHAEGGE